MLQAVRLVTVHPALVHFTIGALPIFVLAYLVAATRHQERYSLVGDVALAVGAVLTVIAAAFGLVAFFAVGWPGGLGRWRWLHLGLGVAVTVLWLAFAIGRLWQRQRRTAPTGWGTFGVAAGLSLLVLFTGWIGGEVLVFRGGIAVAAAGEGAFAPPLSRPRTPRNLADAMGQVRAAWGQASAVTARMLVRSPTDDGYATIAADGRRLVALASWMAREGADTLPNASALVPMEDEAHEPPSDHEHAHADEHSYEHAYEHAHPGPMPRAAHLKVMSVDFGNQAAALAKAGDERDLTGIAGKLGELGAACADCHEELRWPATSPPNLAGR